MKEPMVPGEGLVGPEETQRHDYHGDSLYQHEDFIFGVE